ncbi:MULTISPECIES: PQQ-dependent sugar dehydrogenase [Sphingobacterium]|jgi:glucose/arabinose dehydrogenase|uniref:Glucose dehydrogenase n=1 Tax=Sphingobacterium multivorum TaxID=28454 RepID=A0A654DRA0_SPHMU|nr:MULTISPECIES: PQQ-dependent sugar dehydrogenase [Sphingobacterium]QQT46505.1 PQQ-dependent sugar dehydrogenase [Sphingobacterium multivorum]SUJ90045.1 Soluble aldose sugar dehydrogenase yliI precursor [Sphingobacterium multivorum]VXD07997.1 Glucose dehydrogenase [Sphingobacterium multivorum]HBI88613.1 glucose dehydrogenase [Sphingobacterium sp.]
MKTKLTISLLTVSLGLTACNSNHANSNSSSDSSSNTATDTTSYPPVETQKANTSYKPAFAGQTRIQGAKTSTPFEGKVIAEGLKSPWGITALPDGRLLISEKEGNFRIATADGKLSDPIKGLPQVNSSGQGGLLGLRLDPKFESNRMIYWVFSDNTAAGTLTAVAKGKLSADEKSIESAKVIYQATPAHKGNLHYGGRIIFDKEGNIILSTGERSDLVTRPLAQDLNAALGKILRITTEGQPAPGNPSIGKPNVRPEIYSYGHRNPQGLALNPETGDLWETEFGPRGGDELNRIEAGKNYGWPTITYGIEYKGDKVGAGIQQKDGLEQPVYYWDPVLSPSGITFYTGQNIPEWKNNLFICGLSSMHIARIILKDNKVVGEERLLGSEGQRFRDITQGKDGALYAITDIGKLYKIDKK